MIKRESNAIRFHFVYLRTTAELLSAIAMVDGGIVVLGTVGLKGRILQHSL
jgi:hypothetical protein